MSSLVVIRINSKARLPKKSTRGSAGLDLYSTQDVTIQSKKNGIVPTGLKLSMPEGTYGRIAPRSGLSLHYMMDVMGGVIDPDYKGEVKVILLNHSDSDFNVCTGDRVAQLILEKYVDVGIVIEKSEFNSSSSSDEEDRDKKRRLGGFGSTGAK